MLEDLTDLYLIMTHYVTNPDSKKANILFLNLADDITNNGSKEFMDIYVLKGKVYIILSFFQKLGKRLM